LESTATKLRGYLVGPVKHSSALASVAVAVAVVAAAVVYNEFPWN